MENFLFFPLLTILLIASIVDLYTKKIPNALIFLGLMVGLGISFYIGGLHSFGDSVLGIVLSFLCLIWFWGVIAAGDIKLLLVVASFLGTLAALKIGLFSILVGSVIFTLMYPKKMMKTSKNFLYLLIYKIPIQAVSKGQAIAFSPFILIAFLLFAIFMA